MADWTSCVVTTVRKEYTLPSPTNWAEVGKVMAAIATELSGQRAGDDTVRVEARDDEIAFWFEVTP
jgi:hypothetical protein